MIRKRKKTGIFLIILQWSGHNAILLRQIIFTMKKSASFKTGIFLISVFTLLSCTISIDEPWSIDLPTDYSRLVINVSEQTKSSIYPEESYIRSLYMMVYDQDNGKLVTAKKFGRNESMEIDLRSGRYDIYITANMNDFEAPVEKKDICNATHEIMYFESMEDALPMCWSGTAELKAGKTTTISASLSRLVAKIGFTVDMGVLEGLEITSVRLCQGVGIMRPFMEGGSRVISKDETIDSDYASVDDLQKLMSGETIYFYTGENCQGQLLPDNTDPWSKVPDSIGEAADLCTYVEMVGEWNETADYEGHITYRFYLGEDATTSFDIRRNSSQNLTLYLEEDNFDRISWKIDASQMDVLQWEVNVDFDKNFHDKDDFYVTEIIRMDFSFDDKGVRYWDKRSHDYFITGVDDEGNTLIEFHDLTDLGDGSFYIHGTCLKEGECNILMINNETGKTECIMEHSSVKTPEIIAGPNGYFSDNKVTGFDEDREYYINGSSKDICLYLVDNDGYNINQGHFHGCDFSLCNWNIGIINNEFGHDLYEYSTITSYPGRTGDDSYAVRYLISFENDGRDEEWNRQLSESLGKSILNFTYTDEYSGASGKQPVSLYCDDISITFMPVPDEKKSILQSEFIYAVDNPSNLSLMIRGLKLNSMSATPDQSDIRPILYPSIDGHTCSDPLLVSCMPYTYCSLNEDSARYTTINGIRCYAADDSGIEQSDIPDQMSMFHTIEARLAYDQDNWNPDFTCTIDLYDTSVHSTTYGSSGYMNCGMLFYAYDETTELYDSNNGIDTDFREYGDLLDKDHIDKFNRLIEVDFSINENNEICAKTSRTAELNITISGSLNGHIRCVTVQDPLFTVWGHYFTHSQKFSSSQTISIGSTAEVVDNSALADAFDKMREIPYYSLLDAWDLEDFTDPYTMAGTVREYLKPTGIDLTIHITSSDGAPVAAKFSGSTEYDYTISSPVTWSTGIFSSVTMVPSSYSGFDDRLDDDDCPPGSLFVAETLYLQPNVTYSNTYGLYHME